MIDDVTRQSILDEEHLKLLSLGYVVSAGIHAFFSLFGLMYVFMGAMFSAIIAHIPESAGKTNQAAPPAFVGWFFVGFGAALVVLFLGVAAAQFYVSLCLKRRKSRTFCMVVAGIICLGFPYGTFLGLLTFLVLGRESVARLFIPQTSA
jgi:hypothetical protein